MAVVSFKCPNCGGELVFDPNTQSYSCPYCNSEFSQEQIDTMQKKTSRLRKLLRRLILQKGRNRKRRQCMSAQLWRRDRDRSDDGSYRMLLLSHPGSIIGESFRIPSAADHSVCNRPEKAEEIFLENMKKKKFVPHGFFSAKQIEKMNGVYFPYWMVDWRGDASMEAEATKVRTWRTGDTEYRETQFYRVYREGNVEFDDMPKIALQKANRKLVEGVQPYDQKAVKPFSMDISPVSRQNGGSRKEAFGAEIARDTEQYAKECLKMICAVTRRYGRFISRWVTDRSDGVMRWFLCGR